MNMIAPECRRKHKRHNYVAPIMILTSNYDDVYDQKKSYYTYATMNNYSTSGMYIETDYAIQPGTKILIKTIYNSYGEATPESDCLYRAEVVWCRQVDDAERMRFGMGIRFFNIETGPMFPV